MDTLTINCAMSEFDTLIVEFQPDNVFFDIHMPQRDVEADVSLDQESATKLRDALTDWLGGGEV